MDCGLRRFGRVPAPVADFASARVADFVQHPRPRRLAWIFRWQKNAADLDGRRRVYHSADGDLCECVDPDDGIAADPHRAAERRGDAAGNRGVARMAVETAVAEIRFERAARDQPAGISEAAARHRKAVEEERRAGGGTSGGSDSAGRIGESAEAKSGRHDRAPERASEKETI